ncbi:MAG TPA: YdaU family protein [Sideroxyarcus sp.]|nr:YdaU family protein [Sideroxyarcus sp.]
MNKTDAWMPLWIGAYLADTLHLSRDEHGGYLLLIMAYWRNGGPLQDDDKKMAAIVRATQKEWKSLKPVLAEFFDCSEGQWSHKRIDQELSSASDKQSKAKSKAQAAAQARWKDTTSTASGNASSIPQAVHKECPTPTPSPTPSISVSKSSGTHTEHISEHGAGACLTAGAVCKRIIELGIPPTTCNPGHPDLAALLAAGAAMPEFEGAARVCVEKGKGFPYLLGIVKGQREQAAALVLHKGAMPNKQEALEAGNRTVAETWVPPELKTGTGGAA